MIRRPALSLALLLTLLGGTSISSAQSSLPYELRQVSNRYPVQLITGKDCRSCEAGRQLLALRGIPFTEKRVETNADAAALKALTGAQSLPVLQVGRQQLVGLVSQEWHNYLDAAGYPKDSKLPASWRNPAPTPLAPAAAEAAPAAPAVPEVPVAPAPTDPAQPKIRF